MNELEVRDISARFASVIGHVSPPTHTDLDNVFRRSGVASPQHVGAMSISKPKRVNAAFDDALRQGLPVVQRLVEETAAELRRARVYRSPHEDLAQDISDLRKTLAIAGWRLQDDGTLVRDDNVGVETGGRDALRQQIDRLNNAGDDVAHVLGLSKDALEATARFIVTERGETVGKNDSMPQLLNRAMDLLDLQRKPADTTAEAKAVAALHQSITRNADALNTLRNDQGTGHGRTAIATLPSNGARFVMQQTLTCIHYLLSTHDQ